MFQTLHAMFEEEYTELATAVDEVAERIRALGHPAPGSYAAFSRLSSIEESEEVPPAEDVIRQLVAGHEAVAATVRSIFPAAEAGNDEVTADLLTQPHAGARKDGLDAPQLVGVTFCCGP